MHQAVCAQQQSGGQAWSAALRRRYGYNSAEYYTYVISQYAQANIPLETFVADSQYMNQSEIWTLGSNFSQSEVAVRPSRPAVSDASFKRAVCSSARAAALLAARGALWLAAGTPNARLNVLLPVQGIVAGLHANGQRFVPIVEPVVHIRPGYSTYDSGITQNVFIKDVTGAPYIGQVWRMHA